MFIFLERDQFSAFVVFIVAILVVFPIRILKKKEKHRNATFLTNLNGTIIIKLYAVAFSVVRDLYG